MVSKIGVCLMHLLTFLPLSGVRKFTMSFDCMHVLNLQQNFGERDFKCKCQSSYQIFLRKSSLSENFG